jgi:hypothetical protein
MQDYPDLNEVFKQIMLESDGLPARAINLVRRRIPGVMQQAWAIATIVKIMEPVGPEDYSA